MIKNETIRTIVSFFVLTLFFCGAMSSAAFALSLPFTTEPISEADKTVLTSRLRVNLVESEPPRRPIYCFAVRDDGVIAVATRDSENQTVSVYDQDGIFLYSFHFHCGGAYGLAWDGERLAVFLVRSDLLVIYNADGSVQELWKIPYTAENHRIENAMCTTTKYQIGDTTYELKNPKGILKLLPETHTQLVITDSDGQPQLFYDVSGEERVRVIARVAIFFVAGIVCLLVTLEAGKQVRGKKEKNTYG